jgi:hypothetical protein
MEAFLINEYCAICKKFDIHLANQLEKDFPVERLCVLNDKVISQQL